jgi:hypothetical protein
MTPVQPPILATFPHIPPFPNSVPTAPLVRISLAKLLQNDVEEEEQLWNACCDLGFLYLDLRTEKNESTRQEERIGEIRHANVAEKEAFGKDVDGERLLADADKLFKVAEAFFDLPAEEKRKYDFADQKSYFGYVLKFSNFCPSEGQGCAKFDDVDTKTWVQESSIKAEQETEMNSIMFVLCYASSNKPTRANSP